MPPARTPTEGQALIAREALRWTYVLRSRKRWVGGSRASERNEEEARRSLDPIGIRATQLDDIASSDMVVVRIPFESDELIHWESRVFPWEYVLAAATRERRISNRMHDAGRTVADCGERARIRPASMAVMRELLVQAPDTKNAVGTAASAMGERLRALFIDCLPSELREHWTLDNERQRLCDALPPGSEWRVLPFPTRDELCREVAHYKPHLIHFGGLDCHQGLRELRLHLGEQALVEVQTPPPNGIGKVDWVRMRVDEVRADGRLMVDGVLLRGQGPRTEEPMRTRSKPPVQDKEAEDTEGLSYPCLISAEELASTLALSGHTAYLISFNQWNTAARVAPMVVAHRASLASLGFQDAFDDALAEWVHAFLWAELARTGWHLPESFLRLWETVRDLRESVDATGITLWAGAPLFGAPDELRHEAPSALELGAAKPRVTVDIQPMRELNYAVLHNAQPMFETFVLECERPDRTFPVDVSVAVHMGTETACFQRRVAMRHRRVALTQEIHVPLTAGLARAVREAVNTSLHIEVRHDGDVLYADTHRLRLLPVDQWRDNRRDGCWLPSFVQPRDPAVMAAIAAAQRYVRVLRDDPNAGFEGYQLAHVDDERSMRSVDLQVQAIWSTLLHDWRLGYINPPPTYSGTLDSQRLRMPSAVQEHRAGTCIDLTLLFAACLELVDIYPVVFLLEGHALPGWWRHPSYRDEYFEMPIGNLEDADPHPDENNAANAQVVSWHTGKPSWREVRRWIEQRKLVPIETVRLTENCGFVQAIEAGVRALSDRNDFDSMLDIVTARTEGVTPLPIRQEGV